MTMEISMGQDKIQIDDANEMEIGSVSVDFTEYLKKFSKAKIVELASKHGVWSVDELQDITCNVYLSINYPEKTLVMEFIPEYLEQPIVYKYKLELMEVCNPYNVELSNTNGTVTPLDIDLDEEYDDSDSHNDNEVEVKEIASAYNEEKTRIMYEKIGFGKYAKLTYAQLWQVDIDYFEWMLKKIPRVENKIPTEIKQFICSKTSIKDSGIKLIEPKYSFIYSPQNML